MDQKRCHELEQKCVQEEAPPCEARCPIHVDVRGLVKEVAAGRWDRAFQVLCRTMPLAGIVARVCDHPCETECRRAEAGDAVSIGDMERAVVRIGKPPERMPALPNNGKRVAVAGSGLSSLTCALDLKRKGYGVTVFEPTDRLGAAILQTFDGVLPPQVVEKEVNALEAFGVAVSLLERTEAESWLRMAVTSFDAAYLGMDSSDEAIPEAVLVNPLTGETATAGLFTSGDLARHSPILAVAAGRRAAMSIDRYLQGVSLTARREREGSYESRLYVDLRGIAPCQVVSMENSEAGYTGEEARSEALRCLQCECMECVKKCVFMQHQKGYPKRYVRQVSNDATMVMGGARGDTKACELMQPVRTVHCCLPQ